MLVGRYAVLANSCLSLGTRSGRKKFEYCPLSPTTGDSNVARPQAEGRVQKFWFLYAMAHHKGFELPFSPATSLFCPIPKPHERPLPPATLPFPMPSPILYPLAMTTPRSLRPAPTLQHRNEIRNCFPEKPLSVSYDPALNTRHNMETIPLLSPLVSLSSSDPVVSRWNRDCTPE